MEGDRVGVKDTTSLLCIAEAHAHISHVLKYRRDGAWHPNVMRLLQSLFGGGGAVEQAPGLRQYTFNLRGRVDVSHISPETFDHIDRVLEKLSIDKKCAACGKVSGLSFCERCSATYYCSPACQKAHWPEHRELCKRLADG